MPKIQEPLAATPNADSPPARRRSRTLAAAVVLSLTALYSTSSPQSFPTWCGQQSPYKIEVERPLPKGPYALCSSLGETGSPARSIYTVDANNSQVECILVKNGTIAGSGDLSESSFYIRLGNNTLFYKKLSSRTTPQLETRTCKLCVFRLAPS